MLISEAYRKEQEQLHENPQYGVMGHIYGDLVRTVMTQVEAKEILDYGAGKQSLRQYIYPGIFYRAYDPAIPELSADPKPAQFVACVDVLEHIEPECLDSVLDHLKQLTIHTLFATVHCGAAKKTLSDGRNAHLTQQPMGWWLPKFMDRFDLQSVVRVTNEDKSMNGFWLVAYAC